LNKAHARVVTDGDRIFTNDERENVAPIQNKIMREYQQAKDKEVLANSTTV